MARTIPFVSPMRTIRQIRATDAKPLKAQTKMGKKLQALFPQIDFVADPEKSEDVKSYYLPLLSRLSDRDLLAELGYLARRFGQKNDVFYSANTPLGNLLSRAKNLLLRIDKGEHPGKIDDPLRRVVTQGCVYLRWNMVPYWPGPPLSGDTNARQVHSRRFVYRESDWHLAQLLACCVGSCDISPHELTFIARSWRTAWDKGPEEFSFQSRGYREWAEKLHTSLLERDTQIFCDQASRFKELVGFLRRVPVWRRNPTQVNLSILPYAVVVVKPEPVEAMLVTRPADFGDLLSVPELGDQIGESFQYRLFGDSRKEAPWDGSAIQIEIRF